MRRLEVGKSADMVVLDKNLYEIPVETIHEVEPLITIFRGEEVYSFFCVFGTVTDCPSCKNNEISSSRYVRPQK